MFYDTFVCKDISEVRHVGAVNEQSLSCMINDADIVSSQMVNRMPTRETKIVRRIL